MGFGRKCPESLQKKILNLFILYFADQGKDQLLLLKQQELLKSHESSNDSSKSQVSPPGLMIPPPGMTTPPLPHFVCEGCGIKFKSVSNLQAHQARYCAGLRKASEEAFEAMMLKQKQQQQKALPMLEMMSLLNAKSSLEPEKISSLMMSSMMAAMSSAANASSSSGMKILNFKFSFF